EIPEVDFLAIIRDDVAVEVANGLTNNPVIVFSRSLVEPVEDRLKLDIQPVRERSADRPGLKKVLRIIFPDQVFAQLGQTPVDHESVLIHARAISPLAAKVQADDVTLLNA